MSDRELDDQLKHLKQLVQKNVMHNWGFGPRMRARVHELVNSSRTAGNKETTAGAGRAGDRKTLRSTGEYLPGVLTSLKKAKLACILVPVITICFCVFAFYLLPLEPVNIKTVEEQQVEMDGEWPPDMVKVVRVIDRGTGSANYVAMIWTATSGDRGWDLIYSNPIENGYRPLPIKTISLPEQNNNLVLIATQEEQAGILSYQVLGHDGQKVLTYLERTSILKGDTKTGPGYVFETGNDGYRLFRWNGNGFIEDAAYRPAGD